MSRATQLGPAEMLDTTNGPVIEPDGVDSIGAVSHWAGTFAVPGPSDTGGITP